MEGTKGEHLPPSRRRLCLLPHQLVLLQLKNFPGREHGPIHHYCPVRLRAQEPPRPALQQRHAPCAGGECACVSCQQTSTYKQQQQQEAADVHSLYPAYARTRGVLHQHPHTMLLPRFLLHCTRLSKRSAAAPRGLAVKMCV